MLKRITVTVVTIFAGVAIGALLAVAGHSNSPALAEDVPPPSASQPAGDEKAQQELPAPEPLPQEGYYIKEYKGRVSVLKGDSTVPEMVFDIQTKLLPELDRQQLAQGIYVGTYEELIRLVEDYIS